MFGIVKRRKPIIHHHWIVPLMNFSSDPEAFYQAIEDEFIARQMPDAMLERIEFKQAGLLSGKRLYLRITRERMAVDVGSAPFGTSWYFSCRLCELPRILRAWELLAFMLGLCGFVALYWYLFGMFLGGIVMGASIVFLLIIMLAGRAYGTLDEFLIFLPVVGQVYEALIRRDTYQQQDHRQVFASLVNTILRHKVTEFCQAGGVDDPPFENISSPDQVLTKKELARYLGDEDGRRK
jgi:hypothetical protein